MAQRNIEMLLLLSISLVVASLWGVTVTVAQSQSLSNCINVLLTLSPCLDYITGVSSTPSSNCCSQLASVVSSQPQCLCEVVNGDASSIAASLNINQTQALGIPTACNLQTPPISSCSGSGSGSSSFSPPTGVSVTNIPNYPTGTGSNIVSSTTGNRGSNSGSSYGNSSSTKLQYSLLVLFMLAILSFTFMTTT